MTKLYDKLKDVLDVETINDDDKLEDFDDWDSLSIISILSFLDKEYGINVYTNELQNLKTIKDLIDLVKSKAK
ncbi:MAG: acyl carrier protein [Helicobacteraceae bacterium]|nr:acyl carrier protein [Helicobacteraceae bacterium]